MENYKILLLLRMSRVFGRGLIQGIVKYSRLQGPWVFFKEPVYYLDKAERKMSLSRLKKMEIDGVIMHEIYETEEMTKLGLPTIILPTSQRGRYSPMNEIVADDHAIGKMCAEHFLVRGFKNFACCGYHDMFWSKERGIAFAENISHAGYETHIYEPPETKVRYLWENEQNNLANWLKELPKPVGIMACNDERGEQILEVCRIAQLQIPEQVAVIGVDNDEMICDLSTPPLSSTALNTVKAGYEAAKLMDEMLSGKKIVNRTISVEPTHIITRQSTDILAVKDPVVADALRFINQNSKRPVQVGEVLDAVQISHTILLEKFRESIGRNIHEEIQRVRIEEFARVIIETNLPIYQISNKLNFTSYKHVSRQFKRQKGMSPSAYRKMYALP